MERLWWIICVFIYYVIYAYISKLNNHAIGMRMAIITFIFGAACPFWIIVSRLSKNLLIDVFFYDITMFLAGAITFAALGAGQNFMYYNWIGVGLILLGFILLRLP